jgi:hypothetical protein
MTNINLFDAGKYIGIVKSDTTMNDSSLMEILNVTINGKDVDVLHLRDMDYGIIIPKHIANLIDNALEGK